MIGGGAVDPKENLAYYSTANKSTFVVAPGSYIMSLSSTKGYDGTYSGTSFATPYVSALAGLARSLDAKISYPEFCALLQATVKDLGSDGYDNSYGYGLVDYSAFMTKMSDRSFVDVPEDAWYTTSVYALKSLGIVTGRTFYTFCPDEAVTRGEFVTLLAKMSSDDLSGFYYRGQFKDVAVKDWYNPYINWAANKKIVYGRTETTYSPNANITREEMAAMLCRYMESKGIPFSDRVEMNFSDADSISLWAREPVDLLIKTGLISGFEDNSFRPQATTLRSQSAALLKRILDLQEV